MATPKKKSPVRVPQTPEEVVDMANQNAYYKQLFEQLEKGAARPAYFRESLNQDQAIVVLQNGDEAIVLGTEPDMLANLKAGDMVSVDQRGSCIIAVHATNPRSGQLMTLERVLADGRLEMNEDGRGQVCWPTYKLADDIKENRIKPGAKVIVKPGPQMAIEALPEPDGLNRFRYLVQLPPPNVIAERDMGNPPKWLGRLKQFLKRSLFHPKTNQKYGLRSLFTTLLEGPAGCGKTMSILAGQRVMYQMVSELVDEPIDSLPYRTLRMKASQVFSMWLGESDKNMDRFFDEMEQLAGVPVKIGRREYKLPVWCTIEEFEAIGRQRGQDHGTGGSFDRILTSFLQRLDATRPELKDMTIIMVCTSNEPRLIDHAAMRRIGGVIEHIGMLCKDSFPKVLSKHVAKIPIESDNGTPMESLREMAVNYVTANLFTDERPLVELMTAKGAVKKYRKDLLTPALIDRAVQQAAEIAAEMEADKRTDGVPVKVLVECFESQIQSVARQLDEHNVHKYMDLGDDAINKVRRV